MLLHNYLKINEFEVSLIVSSEIQDITAES